MGVHALEPQRRQGDPSTRPHLVLVPTGRAAVKAARAARPPMHLTRRGRIVVALLVASVVVVVAVILAGRLAVASGEPHVIIVQRGQTLSEIAQRELPQLPIAEGVVRLQVANGMSTPALLAGQTLFIPTS